MHFQVRDRPRLARFHGGCRVDPHVSVSDDQHVACGTGETVGDRVGLDPVAGTVSFDELADLFPERAKMRPRRFTMSVPRLPRDDDRNGHGTGS